MANDALQASVPLDQYRRLGRKTLWIFIINYLAVPIVLLIVAIGLGVANGAGVFAKTPAGNLSDYASWGAVAFSALAIVIFLITLIVAWLIYINYLFMLSDDALKIRRGVFSREEIAIPYRQIQDVDIDQSFVDRIWGVARLVVLTAGHEDEPQPEGESEGILPVIDKKLAEQLQAELLKRTDVQRVSEVEPTA